MNLDPTTATDRRRRRLRRMGMYDLRAYTVKTLEQVAGMCEGEGMVNAATALRELASEWRLRLKRGKRDGEAAKKEAIKP
jgi:hypothetical protein